MRRIKHFLIGGRQFKEEFRKQMRLFIIITLAFTIAFSWRQTIFDATQLLIQKFVTTTPFSSTLLTSISITLISIILIYITAHILKEKRE